MSFLNLTILVGGKYLDKKICAKSFYVVIKPAGRELSHSFALSFKEKGNNLSRIASLLTPLCLKVSHILRKLAIRELGSSLGQKIIHSSGSSK